MLAPARTFGITVARARSLTVKLEERYQRIRQGIRVRAFTDLKAFNMNLRTEPPAINLKACRLSTRSPGTLPPTVTMIKAGAAGTRHGLIRVQACLRSQSSELERRTEGLGPKKQ